MSADFPGPASSELRKCVALTTSGAWLESQKRYLAPVID